MTIEDFIPAGVEIVNQRFATEDQGLGESISSPSDYGMNKGASRGGSWFDGISSFFQGKSMGPNTNTDGVVSDDMYGNRNTTLQPIYPSSVENHDDRIFVYINRLEPGE